MKCSQVLKRKPLESGSSDEYFPYHHPQLCKSRVSLIPYKNLQYSRRLDLQVNI
jgi:hypothetical protein